MRILQLVTKRQYRGAEVFAANLSSELIKLGHEIIFIGLYSNDQNTLILEKAENYDVVSKKSGSFSITLVKKLVQLIKLTKPDIVQCNGSDTLKYMVAASYFLPRTPIVYRNISMISEWMSNGLKKKFYKQVFRRIDHVTSVGKEAINDFIKTFDYPKNKTSVIRRGIPIKSVDAEFELKKLRKQLNLKICDRIAIHIGNFSPEKNHEFLLDIFDELKFSEPTVKLICVGNGLLFSTIEKEIINRKLENTVFLLGFRKDIPELLASSDCFVLTSKVEGVPGVILEASSQHVPSVATNVGGVCEVLENTKTGFIIDDFDKIEFKKALLRILNNRTLKTKLGKNGYDLVVREFDPFKNAKKFENLYIGLIHNN